MRPWNHPDIVKRFRAKTQTNGTDCVHWTAALNGDGYGVFFCREWPQIPGDLVYAHRYAFALEYGIDALPADETLDHTCRRKYCVNPQHLVVLTREDNSARNNRVRNTEPVDAYGDPFEELMI